MGTNIELGAKRRIKQDDFTGYLSPDQLQAYTQWLQTHAPNSRVARNVRFFAEGSYHTGRTLEASLIVLVSNEATSKPGAEPFREKRVTFTVTFPAGDYRPGHGTVLVGAL